MTPREEYLKRASQAGLLPLNSLHHHVMDRIFFEFANGFSFDDVLRQIAADPEIVNFPSIAENPNRAKLVVLRAIQSLVSAGMLNEMVNDTKRYHFAWSPREAGQ
ncbi:MAG: hypothetical protein HZA46_03500 [Planctomycetales bacterium]|nr:hypothetical protein [Planctomycetales bacterium]